jgi:hypothetical protein
MFWFSFIPDALKYCLSSNQLSDIIRFGVFRFLANLKDFKIKTGNKTKFRRLYY